MKVVGLVIGVVGVILLGAALFVGVPVVAPALSLDLSVLWSWTVVQVVVGGVVGVGLARWGFSRYIW